jgi:hypothetical protein
MYNIPWQWTWAGTTEQTQQQVKSNTWKVYTKDELKSLLK